MCGRDLPPEPPQASSAPPAASAPRSPRGFHQASSGETTPLNSFPLQPRLPPGARDPHHEDPCLQLPTTPLGLSGFVFSPWSPRARTPLSPGSVASRGPVPRRGLSSPLGPALPTSWRAPPHPSPLPGPELLRQHCHHVTSPLDGVLRERDLGCLGAAAKQVPRDEGLGPLSGRPARLTAARQLLFMFPNSAPSHPMDP